MNFGKITGYTFLKVTIIFFFLIVFSCRGISQSFSGLILGRSDNEGISEVILLDEAGKEVAKSDQSGYFEANLTAFKSAITFQKQGYKTIVRELQAISVAELMDLRIYLEKIVPDEELSTSLSQEENAFIPVIELDDNDLEEDQIQEISTLLTASRDPFVATAAFSWGPLRFRIRGYQSEDSEVFINGIEMNDLESGRVYWNLWGGLNDVTRNRQSQVGLQSFDYTFGDIGGATSIDMSASQQRQQLKASYSLSNRSYFNRLMLTYSSGTLANGWSYSFSGSRRWAQEGYIPGTFYDAWGYYAAIEKKINKKHKLGFSFFGAPIKRGKAGPSIKLIQEIANTNYYNPYWGYQNGKKRNARVSNTFIPVGILQHKWDISSKTLLTSSVSYQGGRNGSTAFNWSDASDPRADYYQKWPNYYEDEQVQNELTAYLKEDESRRQLNWKQFYNRNWNNYEVVQNANGSGSSVEGNRALYIIEDRRYDFKSYQWNSILQHQLNDKHSLLLGSYFNHYTKRNFKIVEDLLGADYYLDINKYEPGTVRSQFDLDVPNKITKVGDVISYDYLSNIRKWNTWAQWNANWAHVEAFLSAKIEGVSYWRTGKWRNGYFPDNSQGDSEKKRFINYGFKGGLTYKISGRQYVLLNGLAQTRAPYFRNAMISPRTQNGFRDLNNEKVLSGEISYVYRSPRLKAQISGYWTDIKGRISQRSAYFDSDNSRQLTEGEFGNILLSNIDQNHMGIEIAGEYKIGYGFELGWAAALGRYIYTSRMNFKIIPDTDLEPLDLDQKIYSKNFFVPGTPQTALSLELKYNGRKYWFLSVKGNYLADRYLDFYPYRRTSDFIKNLTEDDRPLIRQTTEQELVPPAYTIDLFGGKSFKVKHHFIFLTIGINNLLNDRNIVTGGFEQYRVRARDGKPNFNVFPNKYYYSYGLNYFINLSLRI